MHPVLILLLLVVALVAISALRRRPGLLRHPVVRSILIGAATLGLLYLGTRFHWSVWMFGLAPLLPRLWGAVKRVQAARGPTPGSASRVEADWLRMTIDHDTGKLDGEVLSGAFQGRTLDSLAPGELLALLSECRRNDPEAARLLEAYLDRRLGGDWRRGGPDEEAGADAREAAGSADAPMTAPQALLILGLEPDATREAIVDAHRRLIQKLHPDRGGSSYLAAQINRAKDVLLG